MKNNNIRNSLRQYKKDSPFSQSDNSHFGIKSPIFENRKLPNKMTINLSCNLTLQESERKRRQYRSTSYNYDFFNISKFTKS